MGEDGEDAVIDAGLIADAQRVEHYEIAAYGTAKALATVLGHHRVVKLLDQTLREKITADLTLSRIAEREVNVQAPRQGAEAGAVMDGGSGDESEETAGASAGGNSSSSSQGNESSMRSERGGGRSRRASNRQQSTQRQRQQPRPR
jgi:hypothetical protein